MKGELSSTRSYKRTLKKICHPDQSERTRAQWRDLVFKFVQARKTIERNDLGGSA
jgi:hypothetical protein